MKIFSDRIKFLMERQGINQLHLAGMLNILTSRLNHYINGRHSPDLEMTAKIADVLNTTTDFLFGRTNLIASPTGKRQLHSFKEGSFFDISGSNDRAVQLPVYRSSDPPNSPKIGVINVINYEYALYTMSYALLLDDDSMEPFFKKDDIININELKIDPELLAGEKHICLVRERDDTIGRLLRYVEVQKDMLILTAANLNYPTKLISLKKRRYDIIAGAPLVTLRNMQ